MPWYTVSTIQSVRYKNSSEDQQNIPVYENYVLIEANNPQLAIEKAERHAKEVCSIDDQLHLNRKPAYMKFEGIRKVIEVAEPLSSDDDLQVRQLKTGVELSYSYMEVKDEESLKKLSAGKKVNVSYIDADADS